MYVGFQHRTTALGEEREGPNCVFMPARTFTVSLSAVYPFY